MYAQLKIAVREALVPLMFRYPPLGLQPERLAIYLNCLLARRDLNLPVAEVGCHLCGTTILAFKALRRTGWESQYTCFDTFAGFVPEQFEKDQSIGTPQNLRGMFSNNSMNLARRILDHHGCKEVELVQGDIIRIPDQALAPSYGAVLLDMDLSEPTYQALHRFWRRLASGGVIYVDDCPPEGDWKARVGYRRFCSETGLPEQYQFGLGIVESPS